MIDRITEQFVSEQYFNDQYLSGADSLFFKFTDTVGIKLFVSELMRNRQYDRHIRYKEIAPKVGQKIKVRLEGKIWWGFMVEIVTVGDDLDHDTNTDIVEKVKSHIESMGEIDYANDLHYGNIGLTWNGREVVIDFSRFIDRDGFWFHDRRGYVKYTYNPLAEYGRVGQLTTNGKNWKP